MALIPIQGDFQRLYRAKPTYSVVYFIIKILLSLGTVTTLIVGYSLGIKVATIGSVSSIGVYAITVLIDYIIQLLCALYIRRSVENIVVERKKENSVTARDTANKKAIAIGLQETKQIETSSEGELLCPDGSVAVVAVGYREDGDAWRDCLRSLRKQTLKPRIIIAVVDGNDSPDMEMANIFANEFRDCYARVINLPIQLSAEHKRYHKQALEQERLVRGPLASSISRFAIAKRWLNGSYTPEEIAAHNTAYDKIKIHIREWMISLPIEQDLEAVCFTQPHGHKRTALFTGFAIALYGLTARHAIFTTDSDTLVHKSALDELLCLIQSDDDIGGVTGEVRIWNASHSWLTRICKVRYWMAFNIERGCQSLWRCVGCLSGPMAMYRSCDMDAILGTWNVQTFGGRETTFGDDRHMSNQLLATGRKTRHTHRTFCDSESPATFVRFIRQQTRWTKSYYREAFWFPMQFLYHEWWLLFEAVKQALFPFILIVTLFHMFFSPTSPWRPVIWVGTILLVAEIKALIAFAIEGDFWMLAFGAYGLVYFFGLLPTKVWALCTLTRTQWGTSARSQSEMKVGETFSQRSFHVAYLCVWFALLLVGLAYYLSNVFKSSWYWLIVTGIIPASIGMYVDNYRAIFTTMKKSAIEVYRKAHFFSTKNRTQGYDTEENLSPCTNEAEQIVFDSSEAVLKK